MESCRSIILSMLVRRHGGSIMDEQQESGQEERLRSHPSARFAGESHAFNLGEVLGALRAEAHPAERGHRQMTIFHHAPVTQVIFAFEPGGELADHAANWPIMRRTGW
jgi:hypothetical protein